MIALPHLADELREEAARLASLAERVQWRDPSETLAIDVVRDLVPAGARLYASQARRHSQEGEGRWWYYLVMPRGWRPRESDLSRWLYNEAAGHHWDTGTASTWTKDGPIGPNTKDAVLRAGLKRLLDATVLP